MKGANIVFNRDPYPRRGSKVPASSAKDTLQCALYDLQYVGRGLPAHDLVYFLGTSVESRLLKSLEDERALLQDYFHHFHAIASSGSVDSIDYPFDIFWAHWELAIVDWYRFMAGWGFWGNDRWVERRAKDIVRRWQECGSCL